MNKVVYRLDLYFYLVTSIAVDVSTDWMQTLRE
jgi:hypothetical protein